MSDGFRARGGLALYGLGTTLAAPLLRRYLIRRQRRGREDPERLAERFGHPGLARPDGPLLWVNCASVGESLSALPLLQRLGDERPALRILMTTGTVTSARLMAERLPEGVLHQYVPIDVPAAVNRFLDHWQPDLAFFLEGELWPNLLSLTRRRGIAMALVNGRVSPRSFRSWNRCKPIVGALLRRFTLILAQSEEDRARFEALGAGGVGLAGNLKFAAPPLDADAEELARLKTMLDGRPLWLAASTHPGEEEQIAGAHRTLAARIPKLLTVIAPRHPNRGDEIESLLLDAGLRVARRSRADSVTGEHDIYLADTIGEMGLWFRLADIVFIGKTLVPKGGQNPIEAALLDCAILCGPHSDNFLRITGEMESAGALVRVADRNALARRIGALLDDPARRVGLATAAKDYAARQGRCLDGIAAALAPLLDQVAAKAATR